MARELDAGGGDDRNRARANRRQRPAGGATGGPRHPEPGDAVVTMALAAIGYVAVRRMLAPVAFLTAHVEDLRDGKPTAIPAARVGDARTEIREPLP